MKTLLALLITVLMYAFSMQVHAQFNIGRRIENKTINRANHRTDQAIDKGLDGIEKGIKGDGKKKDKDQTPENNPDKQASDNKDATPKIDQGKQDQLSLQSYSKYDFVPGDKVIFYDDFSQDAIGDFPALWNTNGSAEVVTTNLFPGNWMKFITRDAIWTDELLKLPENYTIEFDVIPIKGTEGGMAGYEFRMIQSKNVKSFDYGSAPGNGGFLYTMEYFGRPGYSTWFNKEGCQELKISGSKEDEAIKEKENKKYHIAIWVQKSRVRLYQDQNKLFDLPKALPIDCIKLDRIRFEDGAAMVSNIRIAVGTPDMRSKLITEGKLVSYGIYFDVNKDVVKPESYGTLKVIADILKENPDVKVKIVGHTDSDGADAANFDLSKRRGASVKDELVKSFGIDASRLESDGKGETQPVAPNDTPANKALNRRVEFIKL
jgi:OmpA-OmpF porin, OOP family